MWGCGDEDTEPLRLPDATLPGARTGRVVCGGRGAALDPRRWRTGVAHIGWRWKEVHRRAACQQQLILRWAHFEVAVQATVAYVPRPENRRTTPRPAALLRAASLLVRLRGAKERTAADTPPHVSSGTCVGVRVGNNAYGCCGGVDASRWMAWWGRCQC
jgi:hypothetical protein